MRWLSATASVEIDRPIETVWAFVTDLANMPHWVDGVSEPAFFSGAGPQPSALGPGVPFTSRYTYAGRTHTMHYVVSAFEPPGRYALKSTEGPYPVELTLRCTSSVRPELVEGPATSSVRPELAEGPAAWFDRLTTNVTGSPSTPRPGGATTLAKTTRAGSDGRVTSAMFLLFGPLLRRLMRRQIAKELARCKAACEG